MVTLRMLGIAVALLVGIPIGLGLADHPGHILIAGGEIANAGLEAGATVTDIVLMETFPQYDKVVVHNAPEQLVEGHTVFVTLDTLLVPNITNWTAEIAGDASCEAHTDIEGQYFFGIPVIPRRINEAHVECRAGGQVFVTPDPFYDSNNTYSSAMTPTGIEIPFVAPHGVRGVAREYAYDVFWTDGWGEEHTERRYAWATPIIEPWTHTDGSTKRWYCPIPVARIIEMDVTHFTGWVSEDGEPPRIAMH